MDREITAPHYPATVWAIRSEDSNAARLVGYPDDYQLGELPRWVRVCGGKSRYEMGSKLDSRNERMHAK